MGGTAGRKKTLQNIGKAYSIIIPLGFIFIAFIITLTINRKIMALDSKVPKGPIKDKWTDYKNHINLVNPANKRHIDVIVVGTGLAGGSAAATLAELGYNVKAFAYQDSPRRAHSIAAQGGINAAKNYQGDGDSTYRLFYDTVKGGDYRSREANVYDWQRFLQIL